MSTTADGQVFDLRLPTPDDFQTSLTAAAFWQQVEDALVHNSATAADGSAADDFLIMLTKLLCFACGRSIYSADRYLSHPCLSAAVALLYRGANPDGFWYNSVPDWVPLKAAASWSRSHVCLLLLDGACVVDSAFLPSALLYASSADIVGLLVEAGADVNFADDDHDRTPLHVARDADVVRALVKAGANVHMTDADGNTPLHYAASVEIARELLTNGACIDAKNTYGRTPLLEGHLNEEVLEFLIKSGADVTVVDENGESFLHLVDSDKMCELALACGGDPRCSAPACQSPTPVFACNGAPLHQAQTPGIVDALVKAGADVNMATVCCGITPLHAAADNLEEGVCDALLKAGANPHSLDTWGMTPLHYARNADSVRSLVSAGASVNAQTPQGVSPLMVFMQRGRIVRKDATKGTFFFGYFRRKK